MDTHSTLPVSTMQKVSQLPLIRLILGFLIVFLPVAVGQIFIMSLDLSRLGRSIAAVTFTIPIACGAYYIFVHFIERRQMTELSPFGAVRETVQGIVIGSLFFSSVIAILAMAGAYKVAGMNSLSVLLPPLFFGISAAVFEEILFRGVLFRGIERSLGSWMALVISAAIFGGLHLMNKDATIIGVIGIMLQTGLTMGAAFMLTRRLWLPMGIHFAGNFTQGGIFGSVVSGNGAESGILRSTFTGPDWLTGGAFGIEASLITIALGLLVGIFLLWRAHKQGNIIRSRVEAGA
ncbi:MAG TPA: type II CAAX endopeptidase family protein [Anaerolineales bacterium]|nr:type II CAAX endopeptidase family protein [Anaerolineales bacterium]